MRPTKLLQMPCIDGTANSSCLNMAVYLKVLSSAYQVMIRIILQIKHHILLFNYQQRRDNFIILGKKSQLF